MLIPNLSAPLPIEALKSNGIHELPGGLKVEDYDYLHTSIYIDEVNLPPAPCHAPSNTPSSHAVEPAAPQDPSPLD